MAPQVKFTYFKVRGRGEIVRLVLAAAGIKYEEELIDFEQWPERKQTTPFGQLPLLTWDGEELSQSLNLARFVGRMGGLAGGEDDVAAARSGMMLEHYSDLYTKYLDIRFCEDPDKKEELRADFAGKVLPQFLKSSEAVLQKAGGKHFTGKGLSVGDVAVFRAVEVATDEKELKGAGFSKKHMGEMRFKVRSSLRLNALATEVRSNDRIAAYLRTRPEYPF